MTPASEVLPEIAVILGGEGATGVDTVNTMGWWRTFFHKSPWFIRTFPRNMTITEDIMYTV
jgi:hypothetical protein